MNLIERINRWGYIAPDRLAHVSGNRTLCYGELIRRSDALAAYLVRTLNTSQNHAPIAVRGHKEPEMLIAFLGAVKSGHAYVPIDTAIPAKRVERIIADSAAPLTLTPAEIAVLTDKPAGGVESSQAVDMDDAFYVMFTSGSTGEPKGIVITMRCLTNFVDWMLAEQAFVEQGETFLNQAPFSFDLSVMDLYCCLATGGTLFSISRDDIANPAQLHRSLARSNVTVWVSTPSFAAMCLVEKTFTVERLPAMKKFLFCGETLTPDTAAELLQRFPKAQVWNTYGPTEATVATTSVRIDQQILARCKPLPIGYPKPGSRVLVRDEDGRPLPDGARGEIVIAGPNVSPGYLGQPDLTARAFFDLEAMHAYHTGDMGHYRDGMLFFDGRRDNQIKLHGHRIELDDVETHLNSLPGVCEGVIVVKVKAGKPDSLVAFVVADQPPSGSGFEAGRALRKELAERLPPYMLPRDFHFLAALPMTANGKVDRRALMEMSK